MHDQRHVARRQAGQSRACARDLVNEAFAAGRLGEASGAGVAILLLRAALACHDGMATFAEAGVSNASD
jgi:hypothetical protein